MTNFIDWLNEELKTRGLSPSSLARQMGTYPATVSNVLNGSRKPGPDFCRALARALGYSQHYVFRQAGLIDDPPPPDYDPDVEVVLRLLQDLPPEERKEAIEYIRFKASRAKGKKTASRATPALGN